MAISVVMPALEMAQETGKLVSWKKKEGEKVAKGDMLLEVETDKAVVEVEAQADGILGGVTARVGDVVPVGQTIALIKGETAKTNGKVNDGSRDVPSVLLTPISITKKNYTLLFTDGFLKKSDVCVGTFKKYCK